MQSSVCRPRFALPTRAVGFQTRSTIARAQATETETETGEQYTVNLPKPIGVRFGRGNDGGAYVVETNEQVGNIDERIKAGDRVVRISASFGEDIWDAKNFGQVMYAIKTRNGDVYLELEDRKGDTSCFEAKEMSEMEKRFQRDRAGGNYGAGTKELQARNYIARKEKERKRKEMFDDALEEFRSGKIEDALFAFEEVKAMEPENYVADNFARVSRIYLVTLYNIACCYSSLKKGEQAMEAMEECMKCGFDDYKKIRADKNLDYMRNTPGFEEMIIKYDEPLFNENAINAIKGLGNLFKRGNK